MVDLLIVLGFVVYSVGAGLVARSKASRSLAEYFLAGRTLRGWQAGTSMAATQFAADTPLLVAGLVATGGIFLLWRLWVYGLAFLLLGFLFAGHWQRAGVLTDAELAEARYSGRGVLALRVFKALYYGTVMNCVVLAMVLIAAVRIAEVFLPWHAWLPAGLYGPVLWAVERTGLEIASGVTGLGPAVATANNLISIHALLAFIAVYSITGGLRSVVATDVGQFVLMMAGTFGYAAVVLREVGGPSAMAERLVEAYGADAAGAMLSFAPTGSAAGAALAPFLLVISMQWLFQRNSDGTGYLAQRSMACRSEADARAAGVVFAWLQVVLRSLPWIVIALGLLVIYPFGAGEPAREGFRAGREMMFVTGMDELLPAGLRGVMLAAMLAALASTIDTHMNWGAGYWSNDVYKRLVCGAWLGREPGDRELVLVARLSNVLILVIAMTVMVNLGSIQEAWYITLLFGAGVGPVLVLRWVWERINVWSEFAAMGASIAVAPLAMIFLANVEDGSGAVVVDREWLRLSVMALAGLGAAVGAALVMPRTDGAALGAFYKKVMPAGFWGRTAREVGDDPRRGPRELGRELWQTAAAAASLFGALYGLGRLAAPHPDVGWWWPAGALAVSAAVAPVWIRGMRRDARGEGPAGVLVGEGERGTEAQKDRGTKAQRDKGTE